VPAHYAGRELDVLDIFSKYSLKIPRIYSIFSCRAGVEVLWARQAGGRIDNPDSLALTFFPHITIDWLYLLSIFYFIIQTTKPIDQVLSYL
jgi:hypothetical protein